MKCILDYISNINPKIFSGQSSVVVIEPTPMMKLVNEQEIQSPIVSFFVHAPIHMKGFLTFFIHH